MTDSAWDFRSAFATASAVIPTLLIALVLQKQLLVSAVHLAEAVKRTFDAVDQRIDQLPRFVRWIATSVNLIGTLTLKGLLKLVPLVFTPAAIVLFAVLAEVLALVGVAIPIGWMQAPAGRGFAFVALGFVGWTILMLLVSVAVGMIEEAGRAGSSEGSEDRPPTD
jgi:hypothetical protein